MRRIVLLGPQRLKPTLNQALSHLGLSGRVAVVTAGWEERELEDDELADYLGRRSFNLRLHARAEAVFERDPELLRGLWWRHDQMQRLARFYRVRLGHALEACRELQRMDTEPGEVQPDLVAALDVVRAIDDHHLRRVSEIQGEFEGQYRPASRSTLVSVRRELARELEQAEVLAIAGGHVEMLLTRLKLFDVVSAFEGPIMAWSAGAMVLADRVILFHDSPPQGPGNAEVHSAGLGLAPGVVPLPHAHRRLRLNDPERVALLARRFAPARCLALADGAMLTLNGQLELGPGVAVLEPTGSVGVAVES